MCAQLTFAFQPEICGEYVEELLIEYETGERCRSRLSGASLDVEVTLERSLLVLEPCYISLVSERTLRLHNRASCTDRMISSSFSDEAVY